MMRLMLADLSRPLPNVYNPPIAPPFNFHDLLWRLILWTVFLIGLCLVVLLINKRWRRVRLAAQTDSLHLQVVVPLSHRANLYLVQVEEQTVAVTSDAGGLRTMILLSPVFADSLAHVTTDRPTGSESSEALEDSHPVHPAAEDASGSPEVMPALWAAASNLPVKLEQKAA
jgi:flagellar biogenesis protein FliO